jgi:hypothetical protein
MPDQIRLNSADVQNIDATLEFIKEVKEGIYVSLDNEVLLEPRQDFSDSNIQEIYYYSIS